MIGIFGGPDFCKFLDKPETVDRETPFGRPSSPVTIGAIGNREVAFIARHGMQHEFPPHKVPYKANIYAFKELGVRRIVAPSAVHSLGRQIMPGHFVVPDQFMNFTRREDTFYEERPVTHVSAAEPYCPELRKLMADTAAAMNLPVHPSGTAVVIDGPRFPSGAESMFYREQGWDIISMTQYPELILARELEMCYVSVSIVADYDAGIKDASDAQAEDAVRAFAENNEKLKKLIFEAVSRIPEIRTCICSRALEGSRN